MITYSHAEFALQFLVDTDEDFARAKTLYDHLYETKKTVIGIEYRKLTGSASEKQKLAESSEAYQKHLKGLYDAQMELEMLKAKRHTHQLTIDMWRSLNSAQKMGNI